MILSSISANSCRFWVFSQLVALASYALQIFSWIPQEWLHLSFPKFRILNIVLFFSLAVLVVLVASDAVRGVVLGCFKQRSATPITQSYLFQQALRVGSKLIPNMRKFVNPQLGLGMNPQVFLRVSCKAKANFIHPCRYFKIFQSQK